MRLILKIANHSRVTRSYDALIKHGQLYHQELQQILQEEKLIYGTPDKILQKLAEESVESTEYHVATEIVSPLLEIGVAKWKQMEPIKNQLDGNIKQLKTVL
jgi:hypothetical protein